MKHEWSGRGGGIDILCQRSKPDTAALKVGNGLQQMRHRPAKAVEFPNHEGVTVAQERERSIQSGSLGLGAGHAAILEDAGRAGGMQDVKLKGEILLGG